MNTSLGSATRQPPGVLVLDAMGVLYSAADDVAELLVPFCREHGSVVDTSAIEEHYVAASLGRLAARDFWSAVGVEGDITQLEPEYLARHELNDGVRDLLVGAQQLGWTTACCSNDVAEWSIMLRDRFGLHDRIAHWVISGEVGVRKPGQAIYERLLRVVDIEPADYLFVDDQVQNLDTAAQLGISTLWFHGEPGSRHTAVSTLAEVADLLQQRTQAPGPHSSSS